MRWSPRSRLQVEDAEREGVLPLILRKAFGRWRARARLTHALQAHGHRRSFFARARRSWWRRVLEDESLRAAALRALFAFLRWAVSGRGAGPVGAAVGAAGTALLYLEGPVGTGLTYGNATWPAVGVATAGDP